MAIAPLYLVAIVLCSVILAGVLLWAARARFGRAGGTGELDVEDQVPMIASGPLASVFKPRGHAATPSVVTMIVQQPEVQMPARARQFTSMRTSRAESMLGGKRKSHVAGRDSQITLIEDEILDYHLTNPSRGSTHLLSPVREAHAVPRPASSFSINGSVTASVLYYVEDEQPGAGKTDTTAPRSSFAFPALSLSRGPKAYFPSHSRQFSAASNSKHRSFAASIRFPGASPPVSPIGSVFNFGKTHKKQLSMPEATMENQRTVIREGFQPLLPDELVLKAGEVVTVIETYDDGWCVIGRTHLGQVEIGAVPEWVFNVTGDEARAMRSSSLGVTVSLRVVESFGEGKTGFGGEGAYRDSMISWSNLMM